MKRLSLALFTILFALPLIAHGQDAIRSIDRQSDRAEVARAIAGLKSLENDVIVYHSLGDFQANRKPARVSLDVFRRDLLRVSAEVEGVLSRLPEGKLKAEISNALQSFQDGVYWWEKCYLPLTVSVTDFAQGLTARGPSDEAYEATIPYTVAINWRQASRFIKRAEAIVSKQNVIATTSLNVSRV